MSSAEKKTAESGIEGPGGAATACGQAVIDPAPAPGRTAVDPVRTRGQNVVDPTRSCGQEAVEPANTCGQEAVPAKEEAPTACGQAVEPAQTCGDTAQYRHLDPLEMDSWRAFLAASTAVTARLNHELEAGCGISMHEYEILVRLSEAPQHSMRMSTLAEHVAHSRSRLTHTVGRLEKEGYVVRVSCASDKRGVNCELTEAGLAFLRKAAPVHLDGVRRHVLDRLSRDELGLLSQLMKVISAAPGTQAA
ncbi:MAG: MarR family transcriptional regulator [Actinomyces bowdenii]|nr:MarR family transcriptional regulator [Actinomyces bowdenii]